MNLLIVGEGNSDVRPGSADRLVEDRPGVLRHLVSRIVADQRKSPLEDWEVRATHLLRLHSVRSGYAEKVLTAVALAAVNRDTEIVFVVDQDGAEDRLAELQSGLALAMDPDARKLRGERRVAALWTEASKDVAGPMPKDHEVEARILCLAGRTAIGVAIETIEAWLLADVRAINAALGPSPAESEYRDPETYDGAPGSSDHPKTVFTAIVKRATLNQDRPHDAVAAEADVSVIETRCRRGFAPFAEEVRKLVR